VLASREEARHDAFTLATVGPDRIVSARIVLAEILDDGTALFASSTKSRKAQQLRSSPAAALVAFWPGRERQLRLEGLVVLASEHKADEMFARRPRELQLLAWASSDGQPQTPAQYEHEYKRFDRKFQGCPIPRPESWRVYTLAPSQYEFWESNHNWHHACVRYAQQPNGRWKHTFVGP
jgi:pyridoxamine 5'-phosphate oxidase